MLSDDAVLITGLKDSTGVLGGKPFSNPGRAWRCRIKISPFKK